MCDGADGGWGSGCEIFCQGYGPMGVWIVWMSASATVAPITHASKLHSFLPDMPRCCVLGSRAFFTGSPAGDRGTHDRARLSAIGILFSAPRVAQGRPRRRSPARHRPTRALFGMAPGRSRIASLEYVTRQAPHPSFRGHRTTLVPRPPAMMLSAERRIRGYPLRRPQVAPTDGKPETRWRAISKPKRALVWAA